MIVEYHKESTKSILELELGRSQDIKLTCKKIKKKHFYILTMNMEKTAINSIIPFTITSNIMKDLGTHLTKYVQNMYIKIIKFR